MLVDYQEGTDIYRSFRTVFARSEGYRQRPEATHNPKVVGSNPTPATTEIARRAMPYHWRSSLRRSQFSARRGPGGGVRASAGPAFSGRLPLAYPISEKPRLRHETGSFWFERSP